MNNSLKRARGVVFPVFFLLSHPVISQDDPSKDQQSALRVYSEVPGLVPSDKYSFRIRVVGRANWSKVFAFITTCKEGVKGKNNYFSHLSGWTNTYLNFEMRDEPVEVEISRPDGQAIQKAAAHPRRQAKTCLVRDGKVYVIIEKPCLIAVDIDGQMDDQDTGKTKTGKYTGPPIHTVTVFANPFIQRTSTTPASTSSSLARRHRVKERGKRSPSCLEFMTLASHSRFTRTKITTSRETRLCMAL